MAKVIHKYGPLGFNETKYEGEIVHVGQQNDETFIWCEKHTVLTNPKGVVWIVATGDPYNGTYHGTAIDIEGYVWHVVGKTVIAIGGLHE